MSEWAIRDAFRKHLDHHGHGFHHAVIRRIDELCQQQGVQWERLAVEYPVQVGQQSTHIDFVRWHAGLNYLMVAECKRVNPALRHWCFCRIPNQQSTAKRLHFEHLTVKAGTLRARLASDQIAKTQPYDLAFEVKGRESGDKGNGRGGLDVALKQLSTGFNGLIEELRGYPKVAEKLGTEVTILPVLFTTAALVVTDADISLASLDDGLLPEAPPFEAQEDVPWLWYTYQRPRGVSPAPVATHDVDTLAQLQSLAYRRTVAIVNAGGICSVPQFDEALWEG